MPERNILIIYDIADNKRRVKISKILESYGVRIQESAFECFLSPFKLTELKKKLEQHIKKSEDLLFIYKLNSQNVVYKYGNYNEPQNINFDVI